MLWPARKPPAQPESEPQPPPWGAKPTDPPHTRCPPSRHCHREDEGGRANSGRRCPGNAQSEPPSPSGAGGASLRASQMGGPQSPRRGEPEGHPQWQSAPLPLKGGPVDFAVPRRIEPPPALPTLGEAAANRSAAERRHRPTAGTRSHPALAQASRHGLVPRPRGVPTEGPREGPQSGAPRGLQDGGGH